MVAHGSVLPGPGSRKTNLESQSLVHSIETTGKAGFTADAKRFSFMKVRRMIAFYGSSKLGLLQQPLAYAPDDMKLESS